MKKIYIKPNTEQVKVQLTSGVLENDVIVGPTSEYSHISLGKENDFFDDFNSEEDIWGGQSIQMKDVWER